MSDLVPINEVEWKTVKYLKIHDHGPEEEHPWEFELVLPRPLADWDVYEKWEVERTRSMRDNLKQGNILFDIGAEHGWLSVIYSKFVGAENMVLFEPTPEFWPNLKQTWKANGLPDPKGFWCGLVGAENKHHGPGINLTEWPTEANVDVMIDKLKYLYIHENGHNTPQITIDEFVKQSGIVPDALTMDTEGAEVLILRGAEKTLREHKPLVWASLHEDLAIRDGYGDISNVYEFMRSLGYQNKYLATDHEIHECWWHPDGRHIV